MLHQKMLQCALFAQQTMATQLANVPEPFGVLHQRMLGGCAARRDAHATIGHRAVFGQLRGMDEQHVRAQIVERAVRNQAGGAFEHKRGELREAGMRLGRVHGQE